eukprot:2446648-Rhodomonas_salina.1
MPVAAYAMRVLRVHDCHGGMVLWYGAMVWYAAMVCCYGLLLWYGGILLSEYSSTVVAVQYGGMEWYYDMLLRYAGTPNAMSLFRYRKLLWYADTSRREGTEPYGGDVPHDLKRHVIAP